MKSIINLLQYYIADCVSWVPRLTLLYLTNKMDLRTCSQNGTRSYVGDLLYVIYVPEARKAMKKFVNRSWKERVMLCSGKTLGNTITYATWNTENVFNEFVLLAEEISKVNAKSAS